jgi:hypothetical protein
MADATEAVIGLIPLGIVSGFATKMAGELDPEGKKKHKKHKKLKKFGVPDIEDKQAKRKKSKLKMVM